MPGYDPNDPNMDSQAEERQRNDANQQILRSVEELVRQNRTYQQWLAARGGRLSDEDRKQAAAILRQSGVTIPEGMEVRADGSVAPIDHTTRNRIITAAMAAPLFLPGGGAAASGGAAAPAVGGSSAAQALVPSTLTGFTTPGVGAAATTTGIASTGGSAAPIASVAGRAAAPAAAARGSSLWRDLVDVGTNIVGTYISDRAIRDATQAQLDAVNRAIDLQQQMFEQTRRDQMPWLRAGQSGVRALSVGLGLGDPGGSLDAEGGASSAGPSTPAAEPMRLAQRSPSSPQTTPVPARNYTGATAVPRGTSPIASITAPPGGQPAADPMTSSYVTMVSPDGLSTRQVPAHQQSFYEQRGARVVSNG